MFNRNVLIIGTAPQGLFLNRLFSREGIETFVITTNKKIGFYSRYGTKIYAPTEKQFRDAVNVIYQKLGKIDCYLTSGPELYYCTTQFPELFEMFNVSPRPLQDVRLLANKIKTYDFAKSLGISTLFTIRGDLISSMKDIAFPCIVKWNSEINLFKENPKFKTYIAHDQSELGSFLASFSRENLKSIIIQQYIDSPQLHNISYFAYYHEGDHKFGILGQQIRQYPQGVTSFLREYLNREAESAIYQSKLLLSRTSYTGYCEIEFKIDSSFSNLYILEVNPRPCGWTSAIGGKFQNVLSGMCGEKAVLKNDVVTWVNVQRDLVAIFLEFYKTKKVRKLYKNLTSIMNSNTQDVFDLRDIRPFLYNFFKINVF